MPSEVDQQQQIWNDDEVVDQEWVGGVGAVGEKNAGLHRQSSLPTRYNKGAFDHLRSTLDCGQDSLFILLFFKRTQRFLARLKTVKQAL